MGGGSSGWAGTVERGGSGFRVRHSTARHSTAHHSTSQHTTAQHTIQHSTAYYSTTQHNTAPTAAQESLPPYLPPSLPPLPPSLPPCHFPSCVVRLGRVCLFFFFRFSFTAECSPACQLTKVRTPPKKIGGMLLRSLVSSGGPLRELFTPLRELFYPSVNYLPPSVNSFTPP